MGLFHCPMGAPFYDDDACIDCGLCLATTKEEMVEASRRIRAYLKSHAERTATISKIAVCGKGGVGKSTITTLVAKAIRRKGYRVAVLDADESNPGLCRMLGCDRAPEPLIALINRSSLDDATPHAEWLRKEQVSIQDIPSEYVSNCSGLEFLAVGKIEDPLQGCACSMADLARTLMAKMVIGNEEILLVDMEAGIESFGRGVERYVDTVLTVVEPSFESMALAEKISYMAEGLGIGRVGAVLNKVPSEKARQRMTDELTKKGVKPLGTVYFDPQLSEWGFEGATPGASKADLDTDILVGVLLQEAEGSG
jgi:CO dehydrogenase maturation factor